MAKRKATKEYRKMIEREAARAGAIVEYSHTGSCHNVAKFTLNGKSRKYFFPESPSDAYRGAKNGRCDVRRVLRDLRQLARGES